MDVSQLACNVIAAYYVAGVRVALAAACRLGIDDNTEPLGCGIS